MLSPVNSILEYRYSMNLHSCGLCQPVVDATAYSKEENTCRAESKGKTCSAVALECRQRSICLVYVHALHNLQVVVK